MKYTGVFSPVVALLFQPNTRTTSHGIKFPCPTFFGYVVRKKYPQRDQQASDQIHLVIGGNEGARKKRERRARMCTPSLLRETIVNRTYGIHKNLYI